VTTVEVAPRGRRPPIRLRPVPPYDPPYDDEVKPEVWATAHQLAFDWAEPTVTGRRGPAEEPATTGTGAAVAGASTEAKQAVRRFVGVCVEVINGFRPAAHLRPLSRPGEAAGVVSQALAAAQRAAEIRRATHARRGQRTPVAVLRLRLCEPCPGVVEAAVLLVTGDRTWAVAVRMEQHQQSWAATTLRLV
jgi:hypothetical protein